MRMPRVGVYNPPRKMGKMGLQKYQVSKTGGGRKLGLLRRFFHPLFVLGQSEKFKLQARGVQLPSRCSGPVVLGRDRQK